MMTNKETLRTRIIIAQLLDIPPDDVTSIPLHAKRYPLPITMFEFSYREMVLVIGVTGEPDSVEELRSKIEEMVEDADNFIEEQKSK